VNPGSCYSREDNCTHYHHCLPEVKLSTTCHYRKLKSLLQQTSHFVPKPRPVSRGQQETTFLSLELREKGVRGKVRTGRELVTASSIRISSCLGHYRFLINNLIHKNTTQLLVPLSLLSSGNRSSFTSKNSFNNVHFLRP
jgi:hypothetical protein